MLMMLGSDVDRIAGKLGRLGSSARRRGNELEGSRRSPANTASSISSVGSAAGGDMLA